MKHAILVCLSVVSLLLISCGKSRSQETPLPDYYLLASEVVSIDKQTINSGDITILKLTLTEEASSRMDGYVQAFHQSSSVLELSVIGEEESIQMRLTSPFDSRMYSPYWYIIGENDIFVLTDSLPAILSALGRKE